MDSNNHVTTHTAWQRFISVVVLTALIVGSVLLIIQLRSTVPRTLWPASDVVTLTGYGQLSPIKSSDPTSDVLNRSQALALDQELATLQVGGRPDCHENTVVFTLAIAPHQDHVPNWKVKEWACPAPGTIYIESASGIQTYLASVCGVSLMVNGDLPKGRATGTRSEYKPLCSQ
jgi:multidrug efflux pump subunit AcrB